MNTGVQRSGATPPAARTATTQAVGPEPGNPFGQGKDMPRIAMAHEIPYVATATVAELHDLEAKVEHAMSLRGARYLHVLVPCPLGWGSAPCDTIAGPAGPAQTGLFPVFEAEHGEVTASPDPRARAGRGVPAPAEALRATCSAPEPRTDVIDASAGDRRPQHRADYGADADGQAVRNHPRRRIQPGEPHRHVAQRAPGLRRRPAAVQPRVPGRRADPGVAVPRRGRQLRGGVARAGAGQPVPRGDGPRLLPPVRDRLQPRRSSTRRSASTRSSGSSATRRSAGAGRCPPVPRRPGKRVLIVGAGPAGLSAAYHLARLGHDVDDPRGRTDARRHDALRHPHLPPTTRRARRRDRSGSSTLGITLHCDTQGRRPRRGDGEGGFDAAFLAVGAHLGQRAYIPAGEAARVLDARRGPPRHGGRGAPAARPPGRRLRRRQHGDGRRPDRAPARRRPTRSSSTAAPRSRCRRTTSRSQEALEEGVAMRWLSTIKHADAASLTLERWSSTRRLPAADRRARGARGRLARSRARAGRRPVAARRRARSGRHRRRRRGGWRHDDRPARRLRGRRHGARRALGDRRHRSRPDGRPAHRRVATRRAGGRRRRRARADRVRPAQPVVLQRRAAHRRARGSSSPAARRPSTRSSGGLDAETALFEARRCLSCGNCFECDNCYGVCPDNAVLKLGPGARYAIDFDYCKGCGICVAECPCGAIEMHPETI